MMQRIVMCEHLIRRMKWAVAILFLVTTLGSCSTFDNIDNVHLWDYGTVESGDGGWLILRDDGTLLNIMENFWPAYVFKSGRRVYFNYTVLDENSTRADKQQKLDVKIYRISDVETYDPVMRSTLESNPALAAKVDRDDPVIGIVEMGFSGKYVNVTYEYPRESSYTDDHDDGHIIYMVVDDVSQVEAGRVKICIRHNANGDLPSEKPDAVFVAHKTTDHIVSFNLEPVLDYVEGSSVTVDFEWTVYSDANWSVSETVKRSAFFDPKATSSKVIIRGE
jgi:hypothetical protein